MSVYLASAIGVPYTSIEKIAMPFTFEVWICLLATMLIVIFLFYFCGRVKANVQSELRTAQGTIALIMDILNSAFGGPLSEASIRNGSRFGFAVWLLMSFILRNLYSGSVFTFLQAQVNERPVDTIDRVIELNYIIYATPATYDALYESEPRLRKQ